MSRDARFAGAGTRLAAVCLDVAILSAVFFPVTRAVKGAWIMSASDHRWTRGWLITDPLCLIFLLVIFLYFVLLEGFVGATPGKRILGLRIVSVGGGRPSLGQALVRNVLRLVDGLPALGILAAVLMMTSAERARFGDRVAETRVVFERRRTRRADAAGGRECA